MIDWRVPKSEFGVVGYRRCYGSIRHSLLHHNVAAGRKAHQFVLAVYRLSRTFLRSETFGASSQFRRAAVSIAANVAEGFTKRGKADKLRFLNITQGFLEESRYCLILAQDPDYGDVWS